LYLSGTPGLFGGNYDVGLAMLFASYTDVMPLATERATLFFLTTSMQYVAQTFCPSIGAVLMNLDGHGGTPHVNLLVSLCLAILTALIAIFLFPETIHEVRPDRSPAAPLNPPDSAKASHWRASITSSFQRSTSSFSSPFAGVGLLNILLLALSICFAATGIKAIDWYALVQYPVVKLHWTFPQSSYLVTMEGILMLAHFSLLLPFLTRLATTTLGSSRAASLAIMAGSAALLTLGALGMGLAETSFVFVASVVVYQFGEGLPTATQAYIVGMVDKGKVARVMATLSSASIFGKLVASVLFPKLLAWGLDAEDERMVGLPLFVSAGLFVLSAGCVGVVACSASSGRDEGSG
jgi:MFS family permease